MKNYEKYHKDRSQVSIKTETYEKLNGLKFDFRLKSIDATINQIIKLLENKN